jgi:hypothetical protein
MALAHDEDDTRGHGPTALAVTLLVAAPQAALLVVIDGTRFFLAAAAAPRAQPLS